MVPGTIIPGNPVEAAFDLSAAEIAACAHALRADRDGRFRTAEMSADDTLALRELTATLDRFDLMRSHQAADTVRLSVARLMVLSAAVRDFVVAHGEADVTTAESRTHVAAAARLVDPLADLASQALQAALRGESSDELV